MIGIYGVVGRKTEANKLLKSIKDIMENSEHYDCSSYSHGSYSDDSIMMGIADLTHRSQSIQPVYSKDKNKCLIMFGDLYNEESSRFENDAEFLLHHYEKHGIKRLSELNGQFICAIWNLNKKRLTIINDKFGIYPLYYYHKEGEKTEALIFSSSLSSLIPSINSPQLNEDAVADFITFNYVLGNKTFVRNVELLPPASALEYDLLSGKISTNNYWQVKYSYNSSGESDIDLTLNKLCQTFQKAVTLRYPNKPTTKIGLGLTGGLDTRMILSAIKQFDYKQIYTYLFGSNPQCTDEKIASKIAEMYNIEHKFFCVEPSSWKQWIDEAIMMTDAQLNVVNIIGIPREYKLRNYFLMALHGTGGEFARGWFYDALRFSSKSNIFEKLFEKVSISPQGYYNIFKSPSYAESIFNKSRESLKNVLNKYNYPMEEDSLDTFCLQQWVRRFTLLGGWVLRHFIEVHRPFLDGEYINILLNIHPNFKQNSYLHLACIKRLAPKLSNISTADKPRITLISIINKFPNLKSCIKYIDLFGISKKILNKSRGSWYSEFDTWFRGPLQEYIKDILLNEETCDFWGYDKKNVENLLLEHISKDRNLQTQIGVLVTLELWRRNINKIWPNSLVVRK